MVINARQDEIEFGRMRGRFNLCRGTFVVKIDCDFNT